MGLESDLSVKSKLGFRAPKQFMLCASTRWAFPEISEYFISVKYLRRSLKPVLDLRVTWVCVHDLTRHQNDLKVD